MLNYLVQSDYKTRFTSFPYYIKKNFPAIDRKYGTSLLNGDVFESTNVPYNPFNKDIAKVQLYFDSATAVKIQRSSVMTWTDFFSNIGGIFGLALGMGLISLVELFWVVKQLFF